MDIVPVADCAAMRAFLSFPYQHYADDPLWVAPLLRDQEELFDARRHPFHSRTEVRCFLAVKGGTVAGRVAAIVEREGGGTGAFGFFEAVDSPEVSIALIEAAKQWLAARGCRTMTGPLNPSIHYECGTLVWGFTTGPRIMTSYNPAYYGALLEAAGLRKARDLYAYRLTPEMIATERLDRAQRVLGISGIRIRQGRREHFDEEMAVLARIYNAAWRDNWGTSPLSAEELRFFGRKLKPLVKPELALFAETSDGPVGFALALPDYNEALRHARGRLLPWGWWKLLRHSRDLRTLRVWALGVLDEYRDSGVAPLLYGQLIRNALAAGYLEAELSWVLEDNRQMNRSIEYVGAQHYKTFRLYETATLSA